MQNYYRAGGLTGSSLSIPTGGIFPSDIHVPYKYHHLFFFSVDEFRYIHPESITLIRSDQLFVRSAIIMSSTFSGDETAPFFGFLGAAAALVFSCMGAAYGTAKSGVGVASMGVMRPELVMKSIVPVVMAGVLGIYGLIIAVIISTGINPKAKSYYLFDGYAHLSSGLACGLAGLSAGMAIGIVGDAGVRANAQQPKLFVGMILILIFAEALALYGLIVGIILSSRAGQSRAD
uniref:V-type proton ATPase proteolipid subunit n=1 Tax=Helianthus annuus TaxID=4232 RepID=A0A251RWL1_HELAN